VSQSLRSFLRDAYNAAQAAYGSVEHQQRLEKEGYVRDPELSNEHASVFSKHSSTIIAYRGTVLTDVQDLNADLAIASNLQNYNSAFKTSKSLLEKTKTKYGENGITLTGHSLGGTKAIESGKGTSHKIIAFNPGTGVVPLKADNSTIFQSTSDPISSRLNASNSTIYRREGGHSLSTFESIFTPNKSPSVMVPKPLQDIPDRNPSTRHDIQSVIHQRTSQQVPVRRASALHHQVIASAHSAQANRDTLSRKLNLTPRYAPY
jgi:hypothetical protein